MFKKILLATTLCVSISSFNIAIAQENSAIDSSQGIYIEDFPFLQTLKSKGGIANITFLGEVHGFYGFYVESSDGKQQVFYLTEDGEAAIAGLLFEYNRNGIFNKTGLQLNEMLERLENQKNNIKRAQERFGSSAMNLPNDNTSVLEDNKDSTNTTELTTSNNIPKIAMENSAQQRNGELSAIMPEVSQLPWMSFGKEDAPILYMIADPNCPFCHAAWKELTTAMTSKENPLNIQLRIILVNFLGDNSEQKNTYLYSLMSSDDPETQTLAPRNYITSNAGENLTPAQYNSVDKDSEQYKKALEKMKMVSDFVNKHKDAINKTPTLIYEDANNKDVVYSLGLPNNLNAFLKDINK